MGFSPNYEVSSNLPITNWKLLQGILAMSIHGKKLGVVGVMVGGGMGEGRQEGGSFW